MVTLSLIIPAYNEEKRIQKTLEEYFSFLKNNINFEILVILNGCKDNTLGVVGKFSKKYDNVNFKFVSEIKEYPAQNFKTDLLPYLLHLNKEVIKTIFRKSLRIKK